MDGCYDSDEEHHESVVELEEQLQRKQHDDSEGFAWWLLRLALTHQQLYRMKSFLQLSGLEYSGTFVLLIFEQFLLGFCSNNFNKIYRTASLITSCKCCFQTYRELGKAT